jgi:16S rRNA processing protein RimM
MELIVVGQVIGLHGVRGALKVRSFCSPPDGIFNYRPWTLVRPGPVVIQEIEPDLESAALSKLMVVNAPLKLHSTGAALVVRCADIEDRDQAQLWLGSEIKVPRAALPKLKPDEYYWSDLIGLEVFNREGQHFGRITQMMETGSNDVMIVNGDRERLIPYIPEQFVLQIDLAAKKLTVDWDADF